MKTPAQQFSWRVQGDVARDQLEREACATRFEDDSLTQQQFVEDCDINVLAMRFGMTNQPMPIAPVDPLAYGDFSDVPDLRTALDRVREANERFYSLPWQLRKRFDNRPGKLWEFVNDRDNADEAVRLGLLRMAEPVAPQQDTPPAEPGTGTSAT